MFLWGAVSMCVAAVHTWQALAGLRFLLGILEASFAPGVLFLLSAWYKRGELGRRYSAYYTAVALSGMFGGLIAGGLLQRLDGAHGLAGWRWLFLIEGAGTCLVSLAAFLALPDFPATTRWLSPAERRLASVRLARDSVGDTQATGGADVGHAAALRDALADWRTWAFVLTYMMTTGAQTIQYFVPELVKVRRPTAPPDVERTADAFPPPRYSSSATRASRPSTTRRLCTPAPSWPSWPSASRRTTSTSAPCTSLRPRASPSSPSPSPSAY